MNESGLPGQSPTSELAWSPGGEHIAFLSDRNGDWELFVVDEDGGNQRKMFPAGLDGIRFRYEFAAERVVSWAR